MTMHTADSAQAGLVRHGRSHRTGSQVDDAFAVRPRTGDALRGRFADKQTVARTTHVLLAWRRVPYRLQYSELIY